MHVPQELHDNQQSHLGRSSKAEQPTNMAVLFKLSSTWKQLRHLRRICSKVCTFHCNALDQVHWSFVTFALLQLAIHYELANRPDKVNLSARQLAWFIALASWQLSSNCDCDDFSREGAYAQAGDVLARFDPAYLISCECGAATIHVVLDIIVLPLTKVPRMLVTEADPWTFISIFAGDVYVSARFYSKVVGHSLTLSFLR
eukprot:scaffold207535_cov16-Tisochrysis_lutea.AAC.1